jgi:hypothetical protein
MTVTASPSPPTVDACGHEPPDPPTATTVSLVTRGGTVYEKLPGRVKVLVEVASDSPAAADTGR